MSGTVLAKLELACKQAGSRRAFAEKHSISYHTVRKVFCGYRKPSYEILRALDLEPVCAKPPPSNDDERWRPISGYEGLYEVSDQGRVRSLDRVCTDSKNKGRYLSYGKVLRPGVGSNGYLIVVLYKDGSGKSCTVHRLVADAFLPPDPLRTDVNHINSNRVDARRSCGPAREGRNADRAVHRAHQHRALNRLRKGRRCDAAGDPRRTRSMEAFRRY